MNWLIIRIISVYKEEDLDCIIKENKISIIQVFKQEWRLMKQYHRLDGGPTGLWLNWELNKPKHLQ